ncbi:MAG: hypothetical protein RL238_3131 [Actinomycetota bacterium]|jgi:hypothetical protein
MGMQRWFTVAVLALAVSACSDADESSLCPAFDDFVTAAAALPGDDDLGAADAAADEVGAIRAAADQLAAADDGRHQATLQALTTSLDDLERTLRSFEPDLDAATWRPLVFDSVDDVVDAFAALDEALAQECGDGD